MSNSTDKMSVVVKATKWNNGKSWVYVTLKNSQSFYPSFEDLHRIIQAICYCEDEKYPPPAEGKGMIARFLKDAVFEKDYKVLAEKYNIPERNGEEIVNDNGAIVRVC